MIADEIQSGLARTGFTFACAAEGVVPDVYLLGKALGGGIVPVSAMVSTWPVLGVLEPGQHGSTFGGNPLACAVGREVVAMLRTGEYQARAAVSASACSPGWPRCRARRSARCTGAGCGPVEFAALPGRGVCERLAARGVLAKDTHGTTIGSPAAGHQRSKPRLGPGPDEEVCAGSRNGGRRRSSAPAGRRTQDAGARPRTRPATRRW